MFSKGFSIPIIMQPIVWCQPIRQNPLRPVHGYMMWSEMLNDNYMVVLFSTTMLKMDFEHYYY